MKCHLGSPEMTYSCNVVPTHRKTLVILLQFIHLLSYMFATLSNWCYLIFHYTSNQTLTHTVLDTVVDGYGWQSVVLPVQEAGCVSAVCWTDLLVWNEKMSVKLAVVSEWRNLGITNTHSFKTQFVCFLFQHLFYMTIRVLKKIREVVNVNSATICWDLFF